MRGSMVSFFHPPATPLRPLFICHSILSISLLLHLHSIPQFLCTRWFSHATPTCAAHTHTIWSNKHSVCAIMPTYRHMRQRSFYVQECTCVCACMTVSSLKPSPTQTLDNSQISTLSFLWGQRRRMKNITKRKNERQENPSASRKQTNQMKEENSIRFRLYTEQQMKKSIFGCIMRINNEKATNTLRLLHWHTSFLFNLRHNTIVGATGPILITKHWRGVAFKMEKWTGSKICCLHWWSVTHSFDCLD